MAFQTSLFHILSQGWHRNKALRGSLRLEKTSKITRSNHSPSTAWSVCREERWQWGLQGGVWAGDSSATVRGTENLIKGGYCRDTNGVLCLSPPYRHPLKGAKQMGMCIPQRGGSGLVCCLLCCAAEEAESKAQKQGKKKKAHVGVKGKIPELVIHRPGCVMA